MAETPKPDQIDQFVALIMNALGPTILLALAIFGAGLWLGRLISSEKEKTLNAQISEADKRLTWQKAQSDQVIEVLKQANQALNEQIAKGESDANKIKAAVLEALPQTTKEVFAAVQREGYFRVNAEPTSEREALASGSAAALANQGYLNVRPEGGGRYFIFTPTGVIRGTVKPGEMITDEPKKKS